MPHTEILSQITSISARNHQRTYHWIGKSIFVNRYNISEQTLRMLYEKKGLSSVKIARKYGCSKKTILDKLRRMKISRREAGSNRRDISKEVLEALYARERLSTWKIWKRSETIKIDCGSTKQEQVDLLTSLFSPYGNGWTGIV